MRQDTILLALAVACELCVETLITRAAPSWFYVAHFVEMPNMGSCCRNFSACRGSWYYWPLRVSFGPRLPFRTTTLLQWRQRATRHGPRPRQRSSAAGPSGRQDPEYGTYRDAQSRRQRLCLPAISPRIRGAAAAEPGDQCWLEAIACASQPFFAAAAGRIQCRLIHHSSYLSDSPVLSIWFLNRFVETGPG